MTDNFDYKEYARQIRENSVVENGIVNVSKDLWYQIADIIDDNGNLINRQKAEIEELTFENRQLKTEIKKLQDENKIYEADIRLIAYQRDKRDEEIEQLLNQLNGLNFMEKQIKSETIREFAERLKKTTLEVKLGNYFYKIATDKAIDETAKEMVGE